MSRVRREVYRVPYLPVTPTSVPLISIQFLRSHQLRADALLVRFVILSVEEGGSV